MSQFFALALKTQTVSPPQNQRRHFSSDHWYFGARPSAAVTREHPQKLRSLPGVFVTQCLENSLLVILQSEGTFDKCTSGK